MLFSAPHVRPMGEAALLLEFGDEIDEEINGRVHVLADRLGKITGVAETIPGYASVLVEFDPDRLQVAALREHINRALSSSEQILDSPRIVEIPTRYGGEFGPDLEFVALHNSISPEEVIRLHTSQPFRVFMLGFTPGFPYAGPLPEQIATPRLETPRVRVPSGSVGIAERQTGIYPRESPGGWRLIGQTDLALFDPGLDPPTLLRPGDYLRFVQVDR